MNPLARAAAAALALFLAAGAPALAQPDDSKAPPFVRAVHRLVGAPDGYAPDFRTVRTLVLAHPEICAMQDLTYRNEGAPTGDTLLMCAALAEGAAASPWQRGDVAGAAATFRLVLARTGDRALFALNAQGRCALDCACGCPDAMEALWARYRKARRTPDVTRVLFNIVDGDGQPDLRTVRWLMAHGANPRAQDSQGYTMIQRAEEDREQALADTLSGR